MSDPSTPPKPKPGSLRDRIAAFEKGAQSTGSGPAPPPPRPKPAGFASWKPKAPSPPSSPSAGEHVGATKAGGMSATDAKESIGKGGSLKERMAALQGRGGFGAPVPPVAPKPNVERPKWKPPPVVQTVEPIESKEEDREIEPGAAQEERVTSPPPVISPKPESSSISIKSNDEGEEKHAVEDAEGNGEEKGEVDPEEEERQRRAAIAARMARLGGARVGMGPPIFSAKPAVKKPEPPKEEVKVQEMKAEPEADKEIKEETQPKAEQDEPVKKESTDVPPEDKIKEEAKDEIITEGNLVTSPPQLSSPTPDAAVPAAETKPSSSSSLDPSSVEHSSKHPTSMPVPAVPRRAGPPKRKTPKSPVPPPPAEAKAIEMLDGAEPSDKLAHPAEETKPEPEAEHNPVVVEKVAEPTVGPESVEEKPKVDAHEPVPEEENATPEPDETEDATPLEGDDDLSASALVKTEPVVVPPSVPRGEPLVPTAIPNTVPDKEEGKETEKVEEVVQETIEEEDEEEARKKRIAEKLAKMGGVNPFAPPPVRSPPLPQRKSSTSSETQQPAPETKRKSSVDSSLSRSIAELEEPAKADVNPKEADEKLVEAAEETVAQVAEEEDDEEARRMRIAEKLAKMGGVNPFAPRPPVLQRKSISEEPRATKRGSVGSVSATSPPPPPQRKPSVAESAKEEVHVPKSPPPPQRKPSVAKSVNEDKHSPAKKDSVGSVSVHSINREPEESAKSPEIPQAKSPEIHAQAYSPEIIEEEAGDKDDEDDFTTHRGERYDNDYDSDKHNDESEHIETSNKQMDIIRDESDDEPEPEREQEAPSSPPPQPMRAVPTLPPQPPRAPPPASEAERAVSPPTVSLPPRRMVPQTPEEDEQDDEEEQYEEDESVSENLAASTLFVPPPRARQHDDDDDQSDVSYRGSRRAYDEDTDNESNVAIPIPHRASMAAISLSPDSDAEYTPSTNRPRRAIPNIPRPPSSDIGDSDFGGETLPTRPRVSPGSPSGALGVRGEDLDERTPVVRSPPHRRALPLAPVVPADEDDEEEQELATPSVTPSEQEVLDEEEGDPIDPAFYSPPSRQTSILNLRGAAQKQAVPTSPPVASPPIPTQDEEGEDEQARRRTIAERMARLGGIKFGATPIPPSISRRPPLPPSGGEEGTDEPMEAEEAPELTEEEEERARKERIAAKLAGMGGIRIGMIPGMAPPPRVRPAEQATPASTSPPTRAVPPARPPPPDQAEEEAPARPAQPPRAPPARPPPPPQLQDDSEDDSLQTSDDGVKVEAEESEIEEVSYEDARSPAEEAPPPVPTRIGRRASTSPSVRRDSQDVARSPPVSPRFHSGRPPVPSGLPPRKMSSGTVRSQTRGDSFDSSVQRQPLVHIPHSEYVMVDEPDIIESEESEIPPPPARPAHRPPPRAAPPPSVSNPSDSISSQWELPSIPSSSLDFGAGGGSDLSMSWTEAGEPAGGVSPPPPPPPSKEPPKAQDLHLTSDDLMNIWGRVGVQVCEVATTLFDKSKKSLIGDGSYAGFVHAVLNEVPNASQAYGYGYLIYAQSGSSVQKRVSEILPGDVVELVDAKFKGHKGLQMYNLSVGGANEGPLVGVVGEFEPKKVKIRVFQANQHVGHQSVESTSYRLEDLKSGTVKVYRVLPAN